MNLIILVLLTLVFCLSELIDKLLAEIGLGPDTDEKRKCKESNLKQTTDERLGSMPTCDSRDQFIKCREGC